MVLLRQDDVLPATSKRKMAKVQRGTGPDSLIDKTKGLAKRKKAGDHR
jgi:hypothetical protein